MCDVRKSCKNQVNTIIVLCSSITNVVNLNSRCTFDGSACRAKLDLGMSRISVSLRNLVSHCPGTGNCVTVKLRQRRQSASLRDVQATYDQYHNAVILT